MKAVLPVDRAPHPQDRWLLVSPGAPSEQEIAARTQQVEQEALQAERKLLTRLGIELSGAAQGVRQQKGRCPTVQELEPDWLLLLGDYRLQVEQTPSDCVIVLEPRMVQHTRRTAVKASAQGMLEIEVLGAE